MKRSFIFFILCLLQMSAVFGELRDRKEETLEECARELHVDKDKFLIKLHNQKDNGKISDDESMCMLACGNRKVLSDDFVGIGKKGSLYEVLKMMVDKVYDDGFKHSELTHEDAINKIEKCYATEPIECKFYKCVNLGNKPLNDIFEFYYNQKWLGRRN